jgi:hypothetical protein
MLTRASVLSRTKERELFRTVTVNCKFSLGPSVTDVTTTETGVEDAEGAAATQPDSVRTLRSRVMTSRSLYVLLRELL